MAGKLTVNFELHAEYPLKAFQIAGKAYALKVIEQTPRVVRATFDSSNVALTEDMTFDYSLNPASAGGLQVLAYRDDTGPGFFKASALLPVRASANGRTAQPGRW